MGTIRNAGISIAVALTLAASSLVGTSSARADEPTPVDTAPAGTTTTPPSDATTSPADPTPPVTTPPVQTTTSIARVTAVVDGDTIRTSRGTVRLIGMDTPERGRCGYNTATANARRLAPVGSQVTLVKVAGRDNQDRYGRYLRYVSRNKVDLGGAQIKAGLADARYDSRDGYGWHPKQDTYVALDRANPDKYPHAACSIAPVKKYPPKATSGKYTGCRAYRSNGTSRDEKGRRYTKINCRTKRPL